MPTYERDGAHIEYDLEGHAEGFPVLLIAPGGMRSCNERWSAMPWNPRVALADTYRVIGMDQRNAGRSTAPVSGGDGWHTYRDDQLGLLDHLRDELGIDRCHLVGMCIGGPYIVGLLLAAPERFASAVVLQPAGIDGNRAAYDDVFDGWQADIADRHPEATAADWAAFRTNMWGGDFILTATREQVATIETPMLIAMGDDVYHPSSLSRELAELAPNVTFLERWKDDESLPQTHTAIRAFLAANTP